MRAPGYARRRLISSSKGSGALAAVPIVARTSSQLFADRLFSAAHSSIAAHSSAGKRMERVMRLATFGLQKRSRVSVAVEDGGRVIERRALCRAFQRPVSDRAVAVFALRILGRTERALSGAGVLARSPRFGREAVAESAGVAGHPVAGRLSNCGPSHVGTPLCATGMIPHRCRVSTGGVASEQT